MFRRLFQFPWRTRRQIDADVEDEIRFHIESRSAELVSLGISPSEARRQAEREFGDKDDARSYIKSIDRRAETERRRSETMREFVQDFTYGLRKLVAAPTFTLTVIITLALGVGATAAIFSVVDRTLLRPLNFPDSDRLVRIRFTQRGGGDAGTPMDLPDYRTAKLFDGFSIIEPATLNLLLPNGEPDRANGARVSANHFTLLGNPPLAGRFFAEGEDQVGQPNVAVMTEKLWRNKFGADPKVVGTSLRINGIPHTIIGVVRDGQHIPITTELFTTKRFSAQDLSDDSRGARWLGLMGRVKKDASVDAASAEVTRISEALETRFPEMYRERRATAVDYHTVVFGELKRPLYVMLGAVGLVLLIACANVANLMLVRGASREGEMAVRTALGAGRGRLVRQLFAEGLALTTLGAAAGVALAWFGMRALLGLAPPALLLVAEQSIDGRALALTAAIALLTALVFGLLPAWQVRNSQLVGALRGGGRGSAGGVTANRVRRMIVGAEVALAVVLLSGAALMMRSFQRLMSVDTGFTSDRLLTLRYILPDRAYDTDDKKRAFANQVLERVAAIPGATQVALADNLPLDGGSFNFSFEVRGVTYARGSDQPSAELRRVTPSLFDVFNIPLRAGRSLAASDLNGAPPVMVVNQAFAKKHFPDGQAVGKAIRIGWGPSDKEPWREIVGVVGDVRGEELGAPAQETVYLPQAQTPSSWARIVVQSALPAAQLTSAVRSAVKQVDATLPVYGIQTMEQIVSASVARQKYFAVLITIFASVALVLAAVGLYGTIAYGVSQRTHELGVRVALGATSTNVGGLIVREGLVVTLAGLGVGLIASVLAGGAIEKLLYEVKPGDPVTLGGVAAVLVLVAALASWLPARRAARVDPIVAMRGE